MEWIIVGLLGLIAIQVFRIANGLRSKSNNKISDAEYGENSTRLIMQIIFIEFRIDALAKGVPFTDDDWQKKLETINIGAEILNRGVLSWFASPKKINQNIRKKLIHLMLMVDRDYPEIKGPTFDQGLKDLLRESA